MLVGAIKNFSCLLATLVVTATAHAGVDHVDLSQPGSSYSHEESFQIVSSENWVRFDVLAQTGQYIEWTGYSKPAKTAVATFYELAGRGDLDSRVELFSMPFGTDEGYQELVFSVPPGERYYALLVQATQVEIDNFGFFYNVDGYINFSLANVTPSAPVAAIPEPSTYAMMLMGLGLASFVGRRRKAARSES